MRFSTTALLALPVLASAAESPFEQYKAKFQNFLSSFGATAPGGGADNAGAAGTAPSAATGKAGKAKSVVEPKKIETLTLDNWKDTLYAPVHEGAAQPEEWLVLVSGRNKTCFGHCARIEASFADSALAFASLPAAQSPGHLATVNCDDQPVLCNAWSANAGSLWLLEMLPPPAPVDIHTRRMNLTTVTSQDIVDAYKAKVAGGEEKAEVKEGEVKTSGWHRFPQDGYFHPFEGKLAKLGVAVPLGYLFWGLNAIPSWGMMLLISFVSRTLMNRRMGGMDRQAGAPAAAPRAAAPGDATL